MKQQVVTLEQKREAIRKIMKFSKVQAKGLSEKTVEVAYETLVALPARQERRNREHAHNTRKARHGFKWVNVYEITRHYGGAEEGGWYYNHYELIHAKEVHFRKLDAYLDKIKADAKNEGLEDEGNIYSVRGGSQYRVCVENSRAESQTWERPHYE